jgi:heme/copper-type cytochrome/quinol oxidase subunit 3
VYTYPDLPGWAICNQLSTIGGYVMGASVILLVFIIVKCVRSGAPAGNDPWDANTLEWTTASPPPLRNFTSVIPVTSERAFRDFKRPEDAAGASVQRQMIRRSERNAAMMWLLIGTEAIFFLSLLMAYVYFGSNPGFTVTPSALLNWRSTGIFSVLLWASSFGYWRAEQRFRLKNTQLSQMWLRVTIGLALAFLAGQAKEYYHLVHEHHLTLSSGIFGTAFFTLTGFHGLHVLVGVLLMVLLLVRMNSKPAVLSPQVMRAVGIYWHFVDAVWVVIFSVVYVAPHVLKTAI